VIKNSINVDLIARTSFIPDNDYNNIVKINDDVDIDQTINEMKMRIQSMDSDRHRPFFDCAVGMRTRGIPLNQIENYCNQIAGNDKKMKLKVKGIMNSLSNYRTK